MGDALALLVFPALAAVIFVGIHTWLGLHVLRRKIIFADLALAQLSALGGTLAVAVGHAPSSTAGFSYALAFALLGAVLLTGLRRFSDRINQEAIIGVVYVASAALTILIIDRSPQGAEHVKRMLVGNILTIDGGDVLHLSVLYAAIGGIHAVFRRRLLNAATGKPGADTLWDLLFYASFAVVVTSSVSLAGVLLVFSFLIMPAVIGSLYAQGIYAALWIGWTAGIVASFAGFGASLLLDLPTGAVLVASFTLALCVAAIAKGLLSRRSRAGAAFITGGLWLLIVFCAAMLMQGLWLLAAPRADQPLMAALEMTNLVTPRHFLSEREWAILVDAGGAEDRLRREVERLYDVERNARWQGTALSEEAVQQLSNFQRSYNEMSRGERFVQDHLRQKARMRARWIVAVPAIVLSMLGLAFARMALRRLALRRRARGADALATAE